MLSNPDMHVSELVSQYEERFEGKTIAVEEEEEVEDEHWHRTMGVEVKNWVGKMTGKFLNDRRQAGRRGEKRAAAWKRKGIIVSRWWRSGVEVLMRA